MDFRDIPALSAYCGSRLSAASVDLSERIRIENAQVEERVPEQGIRLYASYFGAVVPNLDAWVDAHREFILQEVALDRTDARVPWTFRPENARNELTLIDVRLNLVRVEDARWPCHLSGLSFEQVSEAVSALGHPDAGKRERAVDLLGRVADTWNAERDQRPLFATLEVEVEDALKESGSTLAETLRDRLGLGHYSPSAGASPVPILVMRYPLSEVYSTHSGSGHPVVPTLLDGGQNDFFFPSPEPGPDADPNPCLGHCLNLTHVSAENDYKLGVELLHKPIDYLPQHFFRTGVIAHPVSMPVDRARRFHLPWLKLYRDRSDFGEGVLS